MGVKGVELLKSVPTFWRLDAWPFVLAHAVNLAMLAMTCSRIVAESSVPASNSSGINSSTPLNSTIGSSSGTAASAAGVAFWGFSLPLMNTVLLPVLAVLQLLTWLGTHWSVKFSSMITMRRVKRVDEAAHVMVTPSKTTEKIGICQIDIVELRNSASGNVEIVPSFEFHKRRYLWEAGEKKWQKVAFPVGESMAFYKNSRGLPDGKAIADAAARWGINSFEVPLPTFKELYTEQCRQPFFVFQVLCVVLWSMDDYWYYSLFTLLMLLMFEGTVVLARTRNLRMLREMMGAPIVVRVYRQGAWMAMHSHHLVPGDLISVNRNKHDPDQTVPADLLLLSGKVVVSEAILTGEATPQEKVCISNRDSDEVLSLKRADDTGDRQHIVFGGTKVLQVVPSQDPQIKGGLPRPPDGGCLAMVVRNGFNTAQGRLVRTILFSSETTSAASREAGIFVVCLLCFALVASGYVLSVSWHDPKRNKGKLLLNCSMIIASVVPPELPMNLSLAVNSSLHSLARLGVFCTEPFRIPFAGKVGVCCFDKTGTLTSEDLVLEGVAGSPPSPSAQCPPPPSASSDASSAPAAEAAVEGEGAEARWVLHKPLAVGDEGVHVLVGCHGLVLLEDGVIGETMERVALESLGWTLGRGDCVAENSGARKRRIQVICVFRFAL